VRRETSAARWSSCSPTEADVVALSRRPTAVPPRVIARIADYADGGALRNGLADVDTLVFISSDGEGTRVLAHHLNVVAAARDCGVAHIVAVSGVDADVDSPFCYAVTNGLTEQAIRESGCGFPLSARRSSPSSSATSCCLPGPPASSACPLEMAELV
jgi:uncharacterized protein YbjT (DUF2867 family)